MLNAGDKIKVYVLQSENEDGNVVLSLRRARAEGIWAKAAEKESSGEGVEAEVREQNKGGLIVNIMGLRGFLPSSQVARTHSGNLMDLVGQQIMVKILEVNRKRIRLIVSQRAAQDEDRARQREELFERLSVGDVVSGRVSGLTSYGAFINLGGADGLIHISELSWDRVSNVSDMLAVGRERAAARRTPGEPPVAAQRLSKVMAELALLRSEVSQALRDFVEYDDSAGRERLMTMASVLRFNNLKLAASEHAPSVCMGALEVVGIAGYRNDSPFSVGRHLRDSLSARLMVANERIHATNAALLLIAKDS